MVTTEQVNEMVRRWNDLDRERVQAEFLDDSRAADDRCFSRRLTIRLTNGSTREASFVNVADANELCEALLESFIGSLVSARTAALDAHEAFMRAAGVEPPKRGDVPPPYEPVSIASPIPPKQPVEYVTPQEYAARLGKLVEAYNRANLTFGKKPEVVLYLSFEGSARPLPFRADPAISEALHAIIHQRCMAEYAEASKQFERLSPLAHPGTKIDTTA